MINGICTNCFTGRHEECSGTCDCLHEAQAPTSTLVERLNTAIDEDERLARAASRGPWHTDHDSYVETIYDGDDNDVVSGGRWGGEASVFTSSKDAFHIVRHDPARILRQVEAHRKLLALHPVQTRTWDNGRIEFGCQCSHECETGGYPIWNDAIECETILALATIYNITPE